MVDPGLAETTGPLPDEVEVETCLRIMAQARAAHPADPRWAAVHDAAAHLYRAGKKARKASRHAERRRRDLEATAASARHRDQDPASVAPDRRDQAPRPLASEAGSAPVAPDHRAAPGGEPAPDQARAEPPDHRITPHRPDAQAAPSGEPAPDQARAEPPGHRVVPHRSDGGVASARRSLVGARRCYVCKGAYRLVHPEYHLLCPDCAEENAVRRYARCDLRGRRAVVTGGRVKIGFQLTLKLLRDGAEVLVTTRFPRDAARRLAAVPDAADWLDRVHVHGVDLLDLAAVAGLLESVRGFGSLDVLINNAAQTIRRPPAYHRETRAAEDVPLSGTAARIDVAGVRRTLGTLAELPMPGSPRRDTLETFFPPGRTDETGQPLDLRDRNSWSLRLHEVDPAEWLEVQLVNSFAPFLLTSRLREPLEASPWPDRYVVQVSAMEGSFSRAHKTVRHPHTNMAKAALNMLTRTAAADYAASGIYMNSVDTGWVTDERPHPDKTAQREAGFRPPLDVIDGAARVYDPIVRGVGGERMSGLFLKDYRPVEW